MGMGEIMTDHSNAIISISSEVVYQLSGTGIDPVSPSQNSLKMLEMNFDYFYGLIHFIATKHPVNQYR